MQDLAGRQARQQFSARRAIGDLAAREHKGKRSGGCVRQRMNFCRAPPRERPIAWLFSPFSARSRAMGLDGGTVDQDLLGGPSGPHEGVKQISPDALCRPANIAIIEGLPRTIVGRSVDPATPRLQHMMIPLITRRSSTRALPRVSVGKCGSIFENCSAVSQK